MIDRRMVVVACLACSLVLGTSACSNLRDAFGLTKRAPDEFAVLTKPPLVIPPDFSLRPPLPGAATGPTSAAATGEARAALLGQGAAAPESQSAAGSVGEQALLARAGADEAAPGIRALILRETTQLEDRDPSFTERLIFWRRAPPAGQAIDAGKEAERLRRAAASGQPPTGGETPVIKRRERGLLEDIF